MTTNKILSILACSMAIYANVSAQSPELIKKNILTAYESLSKRDFAAFKTVCSPDFVELTAGPQPIKGIDACIEAYKSYFVSAPDFTFKVERITVDGNRAIVETTSWGTNTGMVMGMLPPSGKKIKVMDVEIITFDNLAKATSHLTANPNQLFRQIGYGSLENPNTGVVFDIYQRFGKGDVKGILNALSSTISFDVRDNPVAKTKKIYTNKSEIPTFFGELAEACEVTKFEPYKVIADGDYVIAAVKVEWKSKSDGKRWSSDFNHNFKLENNKVVWFQEVTTTPVELKNM